MRELLAVAVAAARRAGRHALRNAARRTEALGRPSHDVKLKLDVECQELASATVRRRYPDHGILGEEDPNAASAKRGGDRICWIIDPIDGTVNFSHGLPMWCCSVAATLGARTLAGAVYAPASDELFAATAGGGARRNRKPIRASAVRRLDQAIVHTGIDKKASPGRPSLTFFRAIAGCVQRPRVTGSAALDICRVACGQADGYFESGIFIWDVAAAGLICREAGGKAETLGRLPGGRLQFLATNGLIHSGLRRVLRAAGAGSRP